MFNIKGGAEKNKVAFESGFVIRTQETKVKAVKKAA